MCDYDVLNDINEVYCADALNLFNDSRETFRTVNGCYRKMEEFN